MIETPPLVDQYCHGVLRTEPGLGAFETYLATTPAPPAPGTTFFETQTGFAVRRWCPPLLGLEPHCPPALSRAPQGTGRTGDREAAAEGHRDRHLPGGHRAAGDLTGPAETAAAGAAQARETVRLDLLAEQVADTSGTVESFLANLAEAVHGAAGTAVAFTSVTGVRHELALAPHPPGPGEVRGAAGRRLAGRRTGGRLADPVVLRHLLWTAVASGLPLQLHAGAAGPGLRIDRTDPVLLTDFAAATAGLGTDPVLPHGYPYHRHAAHLASLFPHVYADLGARARPHRGAGRGRTRGDPGAGALRQAALLRRHAGAAGAARRRRTAVPRGAGQGARRLGRRRRVVADGRRTGGGDDRGGQCPPRLRADRRAAVRRWRPPMSRAGRRAAEPGLRAGARAGSAPAAVPRSTSGTSRACGRRPGSRGPR